MPMPVAGGGLRPWEKKPAETNGKQKKQNKCESWRKKTNMKQKHNNVLQFASHPVYVT